MNQRWTALRVRPHFEWIVALHLQKQAVEHYSPVSQASGNGHKSKVPLVSGYLFCRCEKSMHEAILRIPGVLR
jgi:hypothetical protein